MIERRQHQRRRAFQSGTVAARGRAASDCVVRDVSEGGAMLMLVQAQRAPAEVDVSRGGDRRLARVVWRSDAAVGVAFAPAAPPAAPAGAAVVSLDAVRRARGGGSDEDRLAERMARVTRPRAGAKPFWLTPDTVG